jgi:NDP-hexose-3-ketoreductase
MEKLTNIGVLGCAAIARRSIIPAIKQLEDHFHLSGIASRDKDKAAEFATCFNTMPFTYEGLLADDSIDAIYIPLPNSMHAEWIEKALNKGKHVLVEKSLATTLADAQRLNDLAKNKRLILLENFQFRFHRQMAEIRGILDSGTIGELRCMRSAFGFPPFPDAGNIRYQQALGGGALLDAGTYPIKISQLLLGNDLVVKAAKLNYDQDKQVDIWGGGVLQQANGSLFSQIAFSFDSYYQCNVELTGTKGKLTATRIFTAPPGFAAELILETVKGKESIALPADDHFINVLLHFGRLVNNSISAKEEYDQNINQARLIEDFKCIANEK